MDANLSCSQALSTLRRAFIKMQNDSLNSSHSGPVDDKHNCDMLPRSCGRHNESGRDRAESSDEMFNCSRNSENPRGEFCLLRTGRISDGGTHIFGKEEHHYSGPVISVAE